MKATSWELPVKQLAKPRRPGALTNVRALLAQLVDGFGSNAVARLVDVRPATVTNWRQGRRKMEPRYARRVIDPHYLLSRAFQTFQPETAMRWLTSNDPFLDDRRPLDVLVL